MNRRIKSFILVVSICLFSSLGASSLFAELDPELAQTQNPRIDQTDFFLSAFLAVGPNKLTGHSELGVASAFGVEAGMFRYIGLYNVLHVGMEYSFMLTNYSTSKYEDDLFVPVRLMPKIGYGLVFSKNVITFLDIGVGPVITKLKRKLDESSNSASSDTSLGLAYTLGFNVNIQLHKAISLNAGMRGDLINVKPSEFQIDETDQINGDSITTISYCMNAGLKFNL